MRNKINPTNGAFIFENLAASSICHQEQGAHDHTGFGKATVPISKTTTRNPWLPFNNCQWHARPFRLNPQKSVAEVVKQIKGSSSHWANHDFNPNKNLKLAWQTGYGVFSVSESQAKKAFDYIKKQKEHHAKVTFLEEYKIFLQAHGLEWVEENQLQ